MMVAQQLYEGVEIKGHGTLGLVTYIRTDSVRISKEASMAARESYWILPGRIMRGTMSFQQEKGHTRRPRGHKTQQCETGPAADKGIAYQGSIFAV